MKMNPDLLWDRRNPTYLVNYPKRVFQPENLGMNNAIQLASQVAKIFGYHQGLRLTGSLGIYAQIPNKGRRLSDVDILIDEDSFEGVISLAQNRDYVFCRLSQRELKDGIRTCIFEEVSTGMFLDRKPSVRTVLLKRDRVQTREEINAEDLIDIFVGYIDKEGWERTYDHRLGQIIPREPYRDAIIQIGRRTIRSVPLEHMAMVKQILLSYEEIFGQGNKLDRNKNIFDLESIFQQIPYFREVIPILMEQRKTLTT